MSPHPTHLNRARVLTAAVCLVGLSGWFDTARAGVRADFNGDGILDSVTIGGGSRPAIDITFSRSARRLLIDLRERPILLVATDLDHDGRIDIAGVSSHSRLFFWKNKGGGRFTRVRRPERHNRHAAFELARPLGSVGARRAASQDGALDARNDDDHSYALHLGKRERPPTLGGTGVGQVSVDVPQSFSPASTRSRAPPA